jgi:predicted N-acetyltransferase YhbS
MAPDVQMNGSSVSLREATDDDAPVILTVLQAAFEEYRGRLDPPSGVHTETVETIRSKLKAGHAVLAFVGDAAAGCVFYSLESSRVYLSRLAVLPEHRRHGLGRMLIEHVERKARQSNVKHIQLGLRLVLTGLRAYYERMGYRFVREGAHAGFAAPTYVVLEKEV